MLTLYGHGLSPNCRKVLWALEEAGVTYDFKQVNLPGGEQKTPEFLKLNPNGRVPVLDDDGFILWESNAILWYVGDKLGRGTIVPEDVKLRAQIDQWMWWQVADFTGPSTAFFMKLRERSGQPLDANKHLDILKSSTKAAAVLDKHLERKPFVVGDKFTIADISLAEFAALADGGGVDFGPFANVRRWLGELAERPAYQKTRAKM
jgi:glutathione S-transferase